MADTHEERAQRLEALVADLRRRLDARDEADGRLLASLAAELADLRRWLKERDALNADQHELHEQRWKLSQQVQEHLAGRIAALEEADEEASRRWDEITGVEELQAANAAARARLDSMRPSRVEVTVHVPPATTPDADAAPRALRAGKRAATAGTVIAALVAAAAAAREAWALLVEMFGG